MGAAHDVIAIENGSYFRIRFCENDIICSAHDRGIHPNRLNRQQGMKSLGEFSHPDLIKRGVKCVGN